MFKEPLISVIVPIYNDETYLPQCLDSIIVQTWNNLEIILINDGSTDNSGHICDAYVAKDSRIKVVHKSNGGVSAARNSGLDIANGEYIGFVDSDDWIEPTMYENLFAGFSLGNNVIMTNGMIYRYDGTNDEDSLMRPDLWKRDDPNFIEGRNFAKAMFSESSNHYVWSKLYKRECFDSVRFREGRKDEDTLFIYDMSKILCSSCCNIVEICSAVYHYRIRPNSIVTSEGYIYDRVAALTEIHKDSKNHNTELSELIEERLIASITWYLRDVLWFCNRGNRNFDWKSLHQELMSTSIKAAKRVFKGKSFIFYLGVRYFPEYLHIIRKIYKSLTYERN